MATGMKIFAEIEVVDNEVIVNLVDTNNYRALKSPDGKTYIVERTVREFCPVD